MAVHRISALSDFLSELKGRGMVMSMAERLSASFTGRQGVFSSLKLDKNVNWGSEKGPSKLNSVVISFWACMSFQFWLNCVNWFVSSASRGHCLCYFCGLYIHSPLESQMLPMSKTMTPKLAPINGSSPFALALSHSNCWAPYPTWTTNRPHEGCRCFPKINCRSRRLLEPTQCLFQPALPSGLLFDSKRSGRSWVLAQFGRCRMPG